MKIVNDLSRSILSVVALTLLLNVIVPLSSSASPKPRLLNRSSSILLSGTTTLLVKDNFSDHSSKEVLFLHTRRGSIRLSGRIVERTHYRPGDRISLRGRYDARKKVVKVARILIPPNITKTTAPSFSSVSNPLLPPPLIGEKRVLALIGSFTDVPPLCGASEIQRAMITGSDSTVRLVRDASAGRASVQTDIQDSIKLDIPFSSYNCDTEDDTLHIVGDAFKRAAKNKGIDVTKYDHLVYVVPGPGCKFGGAAIVGHEEVWTHECSSRVITHELGHDWGLLHASTINASGNYNEYSDLSDIMGSDPALLNAPHLIEMGWIDQVDVQEARSSGLYAVAPLYGVKPVGAQPRTVRIQVPSGSGTKSFLVSYRDTSGYFSYLNPFFFLKVNIHEFQGFSYNTKFRAGLDMGESFFDSETGLRVTVTEINSSGAKFTLDGPCVQRAPNVRFGPVAAASSGSVTLPTTLQFTIQNTNSFCAPETFRLVQDLSPTLQLQTLPATLSLASGESRTLPLQVSSLTPSALSGLYSVLIRVGTDDAARRDTAGSATLYFAGGSGVRPVGPQVGSGSFVKAALYAQAPFAPGSMITAFGDNLSGTGEWRLANSLPLPTTLSGTQLSLFNGTKFPLFSVFPNQLNAQVPKSAQPGTFQVFNLAMDSGSMRVALPISAVAPEIYSTNGSANGIAVAETKIGGRPISVESPAQVGQTIYIFGTGGGTSTPMITDGTAPKTADMSLLAKNSQLILSVPTEPRIEVRIRNVSGSKVSDQVGVDRYEVPIPTLPFGRVTNDQLRRVTIRLCAVESESLADVRCSSVVGLPLGK